MPLASALGNPFGASLPVTRALIQALLQGNESIRPERPQRCTRTVKIPGTFASVFRPRPIGALIWVSVDGESPRAPGDTFATEVSSRCCTDGSRTNMH